MSFKRCVGSLVASLAFFLVLSTTAQAYQSGFGGGVGAMIGDPTTVTGQLSLSERSALDVHAGWEIGTGFLLMGSHNWYFPGAFNGAEAPALAAVTPYVGAGLGFYWISDASEKDRYASGDTFVAFLRVPLGLSWVLTSAPLEIFVELAPGVSFVPEVDSEFTGGIGARYRF